MAPFYILKFFLVILPVLICVAFITLLERKVLGLIGIRVGPNKVSLMGVLQPISDAVKLANKQTNSLSNSSFIFYYLSSGFMLFSALVVWTCIISDPSLISWKLPMIVVLVSLSFNSFNSIISGWSTFSKYSLVGTVRTVSQLISYEAILFMLLLLVLHLHNSYSFSSWNFLPFYSMCVFCPLAFYMWLPTILAELNRTPYDFSEGESELVSGFNTEFGSSAFTLIFLAEYSNIIFMSMLSGVLFFSGSVYPAFLSLFCLILWVRSVLPRFRFDKLMKMAWKILIPLSTLVFILSSIWSL